MGKKILVIDDEPELVQAITIRLKTSGYEVTPAFDGEEGIKQAHTVKPDLILLDLVMPRIDGYAVCRELKGNPETKGIPIVIFTASGQRDMEKKCLAGGASRVIRKPFETAKLLGVVEELLK